MPVTGTAPDDLPARLRSLVMESLTLWQTGHRLLPGLGYPLAVEDAEGGSTILIRPDTGPSPFRWSLATPQGEYRCMSIIGVLDELRAAVDAPFPEGPPLRMGVVGAT